MGFDLPHFAAKSSCWVFPPTSLKKGLDRCAQCRLEDPVESLSVSTEFFPFVFLCIVEVIEFSVIMTL